MVKISYNKIIGFFLVIIILFPFSILSYCISNNNNEYSSNNLSALAFEVSDVDLDDLPQIDYNSLNYEWYNQKIEMLIITPPNRPDFVKAVEPLAEWKNLKGVKTIILNDTSGFSGDEAEKIRNMIKYYYERENIRWVLLCGDAEPGLIPIRTVFNDDTGEESGLDAALKPTDFYYADLTGDWNNDGDSRWGESSEDNANGIDEISWTPDVYVGRFPASTANELKIMVNKTLKYEKEPKIGGWMHQMLLAGAVSDTIAEEPLDGEDESRLTDYIIQQYTKTEMNYTHLHDSVSYVPSEPNYALTTSSFDNKFDEGYSTVMFAGHGSPIRFTDTYNNNFYDESDANSCTNTDEASLIYADACTTSPYDNNGYDDSIGENLIKRENAGAIGFIGGLRKTWYYPEDQNLEKLNRGNAKLFWNEFFIEKKFQQGRALYDSKVSYMNSDYLAGGTASMTQSWQRKNVLTYCLLGDPEVDIYTNMPRNASNPFSGNVYEGQLISKNIIDDEGNTIPYARVHLRTEDGKYYTSYADKTGYVNFRIPAKIGEAYNVTITGHNLIPSYFNFTTIDDNIVPELDNEDCTPEQPTVSDNICFDIEANDLQSGLESIYLLKSEDDFDNYDYYEMEHRIIYDDNTYKCEIEKLDPGEYSFLIIGRDWANNYGILDEDDFEIIIGTPIMDYVLIVASITIIGVAAISILVGFMEMNKFKRTTEKLEREK